MLCNICGKEMTQRRGKKGLFWGCLGYPQCTNTMNIEPIQQPKQQPIQQPVQRNSMSDDDRANINAIAIVKSKLEGGYYLKDSVTPYNLNETIYDDYIWFRERLR